jgi:hypothetical protein
MTQTAKGTLLAGNFVPSFWSSVPSYGVIRSDDDGQSWTISNNGPEGRLRDIISLAASPSSEVYAVGAYSDSLYKSIDNGLSWTRLTRPPNMRGVLRYVGVFPPLGVFFAGWGQWISQWQPNTNTWQEINLLLPPAIYSLTQFDSRRVLAASSNGLYLLAWEGPVGVKEVREIPKGFSLSQNYPNPFNPTTTIKFGLPKASPVTLEIYNILGERVRTLLKAENFEPGYWTVNWDGKDNAGFSLPSGIYFYRIVAGEFVKTMKMVMLK